MNHLDFGSISVGAPGSPARLEAEKADRLKEAIRILGVYTTGRFDIWNLAGSSKASCRAHVMSVFNGFKTPQSKSGVNAIRAAFYEAAGITGNCEAEREEIFKEFCRST